ncbi:hypothetical protein GQX74_004503 [Glossina fuscipes]|nr:hypothetical protein GQX74_004503 [Glossina fuscipes]
MFIVFNSAKRKSSLSTKALARCNRVPEVKIIFSKIAIEGTLNRGIDQRNDFEQHQANCTFKCCHFQVFLTENMNKLRGWLSAIQATAMMINKYFRGLEGFSLTAPTY